MLPQNFNVKSQEALARAQQISSEYGQPNLEPIHFLAALTEQEEGVPVLVFKKIGLNLAVLRNQIETEIARLPKSQEIRGGLGQIFISPEMANVLNQSAKEAVRLKDDYVSTEHLLL
ncbi:MAG: hypothetical protein HY982_02825, partial [Candidatus Magasanikbacteria bacterium]|nr:hypothetical protein [Candidatus Magasanikbacteria bacterium]